MTNAVRRIKQSCQSLPSLSLPDTGFKIIETNAFEDCWGAILKERTKDGKEQICRYASGSFKGPELMYHSSHKEILAAKGAIQSFLFFIQHEKFLLRTDLQHFKGRLYKGDPTNKTTYGRLQRWAQWFDGYDFEVEHIPGKLNALADFASRERNHSKSVNITQIFHEFHSPVWDIQNCKGQIDAIKRNDNSMSREAQGHLLYRDYIYVSEYNMTEVAVRFVDPDIPHSDFHSLQEPMVLCTLQWPWRHTRDVEQPDSLPIQGHRLRQLVHRPSTLWKFSFAKLWTEEHPLNFDLWNRPSTQGDRKYINQHFKYFLVKYLPTKLSDSPLLDVSPNTARNVLIQCKIPWFVKVQYYVKANNFQGHHSNPNGQLWKRIILYHTMAIHPPAPGYALRIPDHYMYPSRPHLRPNTDGTTSVSRPWMERNTRNLEPAPLQPDETTSSSDDDTPGPSVLFDSD